MDPLICIAGKNTTAIHGLRHFLGRYRTCFIPTAGDHGVDTWQPSFARQARAWGVPQVTLADIYTEQNLVLFSLEFDTLIRTSRFTSKALFNFHFSKLPKYKGMFPSAHPILNGETATGVTLHLMDDGIDTGDIIDQHDVAIGPDDTVRDLYLKNCEAATRLFDDHADKLLAGDFVARIQPMSGASYYSKHSINYASVVIDLRRTAYEVHNQFRAFTFREFQMPNFGGWSIARSVPTSRRSHLKAGAIVSESAAAFTIATIDFDVELHKDYYPTLWSACAEGDLAGALACMPFTPDLNVRNARGWTALIIAAYHGRLPLVEALLARGADPHVGNYKGTTPLMYALSNYDSTGDHAVFASLAAKVLRTDDVDHLGKTLTDWITEKGRSELLAYLPT